MRCPEAAPLSVVAERSPRVENDRMWGPGLTCVRRPPRPRAGVDPYAHSACRGKKPRPRGAAHILLARQAVEDDDPGRADLWRHRMWQRGKHEQCSGKCSTIRHRAKSTAGTGRIGYGSATRQTANLCGKLHFASPPRLAGPDRGTQPRR